MRLGLLSDSHDNLDVTQRAISLMKQQKVDLVLHLGDITTPSTLMLFADLPTQFVYGNCDWIKKGLSLLYRSLVSEDRVQL